MAAAETYTKHTHVYKTHHATDIHLDVIVSSGNKELSRTAKPVLLWFHGGYLVTGSRNAIPGWLLHYALSHSWTVVSADYRVLPESTALATREDVIAAYEWVAGGSLSRLHPGCNADLDQIILGGASAGGWCALVTALHFSTRPSDHDQQTDERTLPPRPRALWLLYPWIDLGSSKWAQSVTLPSAAPVDPATRQSLLAAIPRQIARGETSVGEDFPASEAELRTRKRLPLLYAMLEGGAFLDYLTGVSGFSERVVQVGLDRAVDGDSRLRALFPLSWGSFTSAFPATCLVHGTADREVPCGESERLVAKLRRRGLEVQYFPVQGADHVFDLELPWSLQDAGEGHQPSATLVRALRALQGFLKEVNGVDR
ncbi:alpha/beta-hydrolase [Aspergillus saccharolyticus JOP 1030-1]|uniref:Alpha/beta-hydrolase n=1 Tax=Aspergillus saccharolyticus JOP 1030-1 TaxID=1450539 RepID=A0A318ZCM6_9EURO|nr:alpha/beta-hydrolase [Aspergillus saccharolyticus JOP 1030-1]PYH44307.1 alpha/beta-hydrolase [Aspergillus saccharolyticus JOP 1030-1]